MIMSTERGAWRCGEVRISRTVVFMSGYLRTSSSVEMSLDAAGKSACATGACVALVSCAHLFLLSVQLLGDAEILHQGKVGRADVGAAAALEAIVEVKFGLHFFVTRFTRQHAEA